MGGLFSSQDHPGAKKKPYNSNGASLLTLAGIKACVANVLRPKLRSHRETTANKHLLRTLTTKAA